MRSIFTAIFAILAGQLFLSPHFIAHAAAEEYFYLIDVDELDLEYKRQPITNVVPCARLDNAVDAWIVPAWRNHRSFQLVIKSSSELKQVTGKIYLPVTPKPGLKAFDVEVDLTEKSIPRTKFLWSMEYYYRAICNTNLAGQSWFRYKLEEAIRQQGNTPNPQRNQNQNFRRGFGGSLDRSFDLFSGSRAIAENIQLDRELRQAETNGELNVDVKTIDGITIKEFDWEPHLKKDLPKFDSLAGFIPHDQHAIFIRSIGSLAALMAESGQLLSPAFGGLNANAVDEQVVPMYLRQMMLDLRKLSTQDFAAQINSIAITGSDPYSELGTDVGVIVEFANENSAESFSAFLFDHVGNKVKLIDGIENSKSFMSHDRSISAFSFRNKNKVWVSNSAFQIGYLKKCFDRNVTAISALDGYRFFRQRYEVADDETAFVFMSDAAIRRWCSPKWRIGQSRRVRAYAELRMQQARFLKECIELKVGETKELSATLQQSNRLGQQTLSHNGVHSEKFGTIAFVTPIAELNVQKVTKAEKDAYEFWRNGYQRNWSQAFDPIAIQVKVKSKSISTDISVIPLILSSDLRSFRDGKPFAKNAGDLHSNPLLHFIFSLGPDDFISSFINGLQTVELFIDDHPNFWRDFADEEDAEEYFQKNINRFPLAARVDFDKPESMQKFVRMASFISNTLVATKTYKDIDYEQRNYDQLWPDVEEFNLFICKHHSTLIVSFSEETLKQIISRIKDREAGSFKDNETRKWLGQNLAIQTNSKFYKAAEVLWNQYYRSELRDQTWRNLPILQEWKREFPDIDPVEFHQKYWKQKLLCAAGGELVWDKKTNYPRSTVFGNPLRPRTPMSTPTPWRSFNSVDAGVTFDTGGVRAKLHIERK